MNIIENCYGCEFKFKCEIEKEVKNNELSCPVYCEKFNCAVCPDCGHEMTKDNCSDDMAEYTAGECSNCSFQCCGGCI